MTPNEEKAKEIANERCKEQMCWGRCNIHKNHHCGYWHYNYECALKGIEYGFSIGKKHYIGRIEQLEKEKSDIAEDFCIQLKELKAQIEQLSNDNHVLKTSFITQQEQIEKMKSFIHSEIDFCTYCPLTNECRNDEGTCPYAYTTEEEKKNLLLDFINKSGR